MKKLFLCLALFAISFFAFGLNNTTVDVNHEIYTVIDNAQIRGLCKPVSNAKPYTQKRILLILDEILENQDKLSKVELEIINKYINESKNENLKENKFGNSFFENKINDVPVNFGILYSFATDASIGVYNKSSHNAFAFDMIPEFRVKGDLGYNLGFNFSGVFNVSKVPLALNGNDYYIGTNWFPYVDQTDGTPVARGTKIRTISSYRNDAWLPYTHVYNSAGRFYWVNNLIPESFGSLKTDMAAYANFYTEIHADFLDDKINIGFGRMTREWAAMDSGSSLVLNRTAVPFYGIDFSFDVNSWLKYSFLTGNLENPNRSDMLNSSYYPDYGTEDAFYFQNSFSLQMVEMNFGNFHLDFGSSVVYPKRFEWGYLFPLTVLVEYQNHAGDFDNVAMFGDLKYTQPGIGSVWVSLFSDEINDFKTNPFTGTREMFALQAGIKAIIPPVPFGSITLRYSKVEPYCYTHHAINYVPYYSHYIMENYTSNGICLGSYLPPNSDEILIRFDAQPLTNIRLSAAYQLTRHGADYGSQQVRGSSLYSELDNKNRDGFNKYFLHDGAYNWIHAISANCSYISKQTTVPFKFDVTLGLVISYFTGIDQTAYNTKDAYGNSNANFDTKYTRLDTEEYPFKVGPVLSLGFTIGNF